MEANQTKNKPPEDTIQIALGPVLVGVILLASLVWSLWRGEIRFAGLCLVLLVGLSMGASLINVKKKQAIAGR